ncbi:MAG TPA: monovalent cation/H+ antiporter complex subunit F [Candidatus Limiplasma sp.]|nr:monovalent cation/H+ antiporter complex subunit F [Candidatus Limiplasma sp.]HRX09400.1 monovalent cation/H+ antiporter complex subunit F [Candidatus Limiplasma sp.]
MTVNLIVFALVGIGVLFSLIRLLFGPSVFDRVVGLDTLNVIVTALIAFLAYVFKNSLYLDIALAYGILSFVETVVFARFLEGKQ